MPSTALGSEPPGLPPGAVLGGWCVRSGEEGSGPGGTYQAPAVGSGLGPGSGDDPGCGPSSRLPQLEQVVQSRPRSGLREKGGRRGGSLKWLLQEPGWHHSSPACVLVGHLLLGMSGLVVENGRVRHTRLRAQCWPGSSPTWPRVASWPQGDGSVHRRWWDSQGRGIRAAGP